MDMTKAAPLILSSERRKHPRVHFNRKVRLCAGEGSHGRFPTRDLSLGGMFIEGTFKLAVGDSCQFVFHETGQRATSLFPFSGKVLRRDANGIGVEFTSMKEESFMFLQTMVLYSSDDPVDVALDFMEDFIPVSKSLC